MLFIRRRIVDGGALFNNALVYSHLKSYFFKRYDRICAMRNIIVKKIRKENTPQYIQPWLLVSFLYSILLLLSI